MSFITTARGFEDDRFVWRIRAAALVVAAGHVKGDPCAARTFAERILSAPLSPNRPLEALVAATQEISDAIEVTDDNTVITEGVKDSEILAAVTAQWLTAARIQGINGTGQ